MNEGRSLIVGASGQVGAEVCRLLGGEALCASRLPSSQAVISVDLEEWAAAPAMASKRIAGCAINAVYCVGGATDVERCEVDQSWAMDVNCRGPAALAAACTEVPFVYFSTEYIFDGADGPYKESALPRPLSIYGMSKWCGEREIFASHPNPLIIRTTTVFGFDRNEKNFIYTLRRRLIAGVVTAVAIDQVSTPTVNTDLATAAIALVRKGQSGVFNVAGPQRMSRYEFAVQIAQANGLSVALLRPAKTSELGQRAKRPLAAGLDISKLRRVLGEDVMRPVSESMTNLRAMRE